MTSWQPDLDGRNGPAYRRIADALAADIGTGRLRPGDRLPPQRDLAWALKVTVGTVGRAYADAARRGLLSGEVGRGSFVRLPEPAVPAPAAPLPATPDAAPINFAQNLPVPGPETALLRETLQAIAADAALEPLLAYHPHLGRPRDRAAAAAWLCDSGIPAAPEHIAVVAGGQHGIAAILAACTEPGDAVATEAMTYPGFKTAARERRLRLDGLAIDAEGLLPDAFAAACRAGPPRLLYLTPNLCNPMAGVLPAERRTAIVEIARRHDVILVEDDVYGFLVDRPPALASLAPERTLLVTALSKSVAPGLRIGYVLAPPAHLERLALAVRSSVWTAPPLMAEIATRWLETGVVRRLAQEKRREAAARQALARRVLGGPGPHAAYHFWLPLPESWRAVDFAAEAERQGVLVTPSTAFAVGRIPPLNGVRVCLSPPAARETVERGFGLLKALAAEEPDRLLAVI